MSDSSPLENAEPCSGFGGIAGTDRSVKLVPPKERLAYSIQEAADLLGVNYFSVYRLVQRNRLKACRALRGKLLIPRSELLRLLKCD